jgi:stearoyl-CoA desaturase (delta-9 desaturase)
MAFQGPVIWWAATHRRHHKLSDDPGDPHSPHLAGAGVAGTLRGFFHSHIGWLFTASSMRPANWAAIVKDLYRDEAIFRVHMTYYYWLAAGIVVPSALCGLVRGSWLGVLMGLLWCGTVRIFLSSHFIWALNSFAHVFGTRAFDLKRDTSRNSLLLAIPTFGQGWHNNHHAFPTAACIDFKWWQLDIGGWIIRGLARAGLAWQLKAPSERATNKYVWATEASSQLDAQPERTGT